jgi:hypothetical protein
MATRAAHGVCLASAAFVLACASGQAGDSCWSHEECLSSSCSFGTCDNGGLLELLALIAEATKEEPAAPKEPAKPACGALDESTCNATPGCYARIMCFPPLCLDAPSDEILACLTCSIDGCGEPCTRIYLCEGGF